MNIRRLAYACSLILFFASLAQAQVPGLVNYQGRVTVGTTNFNSPPNGLFKFVLTNSAGTYYWTNDGSVIQYGSQPTNAVSLPVTKGLYSVLLGDTSIANMTAIPASVWANPDVRLRVWFDDGVNGSQLLSPDQRLAPTAYLASGLTLSGTPTFTGDLNLPVTTSAAAGVLDIGGAPFLHAYGASGLSSQNTFVGDNAGNFSLSGTLNTGSGYQALLSDTSGSGNTAAGTTALKLNTAGNGNTATGFQALLTNNLGSDNSALGNGAAANNTTAGENVAIGSGALYLQSFNNSNAAWNSLNAAVGYHALYSNQPTSTANGIQNSAFGAQSLYSNTTGSHNTGSGFDALNSNSIGNDNSALGYQALNSNTTAGENVAIGSGALLTQSFSNSNATWNSQNVAVGYEALLSNQPTATSNGVRNTATGFIAMISNSTGTDNAAFGASALRSNSTAGQNVAIGSGALQNQSFSNSNTPWNSQNVAVGYQALNNNQPTASNNGNQNAALGTQALYSNTTGQNNAASGYQALYSNTSGNDNTASGSNALHSDTTGGGNTAVGFQALYSNTGSENSAFGYNALYYNTNGHENAAFGEVALFSNSTGNYNTAVGNGALNANRTGSFNTALGFQAGFSNISGTNNIYIGNLNPNTFSSSDVDGESNIIRIGDGSTQTDTYLTGLIHAVSLVAGNSTSEVYLGRTSVGPFSAAANVTLQVSRFGSSESTAVFADQNGNALLEIGAPGFALYVSRSAGIINRSDNATTWDVNSDARVKHDVFAVTGALDTLARLRPVRFHYNADFLAKRPGTRDTEHFGVVAQEFQKIFPDYVDADPDGMLSVRMDPIPIVTAAAVQELNAKVNQRDARIEALEHENRALEQNNKTIEARLQALEARLAPANP